LINLPYSLVLLKLSYVGEARFEKEKTILPYSLVLLKHNIVQALKEKGREIIASILSSSTQTMQKKHGFKPKKVSKKLPYSLVLLKHYYYDYTFSHGVANFHTL